MLKHDFDSIIDRRGGDSEKWNQYGEDVMPLWVADSDFTAPEPVVRALAKRVAHGVYGYPDHMDYALEKAASHWMRSRFNWDVDPAWVCFSPGVSAALALAITAFCKPGGGVLMFTPTYPPFLNLTRVNGREIIASSLRLTDKSWAIDWDDVEEKAKRSDLLLLCNPQNPTGKVFSREELVRLGDICLRNGITVLSDEVHCDYIAEGKRHLPFASLSPELASITLTTINPSKTFNIAGLQAAAVIAPNPELLQRFRTAAAGAAQWGNTLGIIAFHTAYTECAYYADQVAEYVARNMAIAVEFINSKVPGIRAYVPEATYLLWLDCTGLGLEQDALEAFFLEEAKLALNSGTNFGPEGKGFMRLNTACPESQLRLALARLEAAAVKRAKAAR